MTAIMPTYNRSRFLRRAAEQVLAQLWPSMELIIMDDSESPEVLNLGPKVKHMRFANRLTVGEKYSRGYELAQGEYIAHWDDDDHHGPRRILAQMEPLLTSDATISGMPVEYVITAPDARFWRFNDRQLTLRKRQQEGSKLARFHFHDGTALFNREVLRHGVQYPNVKVGGKIIFLNGLMDAGEKEAVVDNRRHFIYVRHGSNTWTFREWALLDPVARPRWFPEDALAFYSGLGAA